MHIGDDRHRLVDELFEGVPADEVVDVFDNIVQLLLVIEDAIIHFVVLLLRLFPFVLQGNMDRRFLPEFIVYPLLISALVSHRDVGADLLHFLHDGISGLLQVLIRLHLATDQLRSAQHRRHAAFSETRLYEARDQ